MPLFAYVLFVGTCPLFQARYIPFGSPAIHFFLYNICLQPEAFRILIPSQMYPAIHDPRKPDSKFAHPATGEAESSAIKGDQRFAPAEATNSGVDAEADSKSRLEIGTCLCDWLLIRIGGWRNAFDDEVFNNYISKDGPAKCTIFKFSHIDGGEFQCTTQISDIFRPNQDRLYKETAQKGRGHKRSPRGDWDQKQRFRLIGVGGPAHVLSNNVTFNHFNKSVTDSV